MQDTERENIPQQKIPQRRCVDFKRRRRQLLWRHAASRIDDVTDITRRRVDDRASQWGAGTEQEGAAHGSKLQPAQEEHDVIASEGEHRKFGGKLVETRLQEAQQPAEEFAEKKKVVFYDANFFIHTTF